MRRLFDALGTGLRQGGADEGQAACGQCRGTSSRDESALEKGTPLECEIAEEPLPMFGEMRAVGIVTEAHGLLRWEGSS